MRSLGLEVVDTLGTDMVICYGLVVRVSTYYWFVTGIGGARRVRSFNAIIRQLR